ncbi:MAG: serine hydrolase [Planctomycetaceae bacterium]|nr:serine hydrolase [Planctomycetaceae bacterium]
MLASALLAWAWATVLTSADAAADTPPPAQAALTQAADYSESHRGQTILVLHNGNVIFERYANGGSIETRQMLASGSKSFVGTAAAAAVADGILNLDDRAGESLHEWQEDVEKASITFRQLLTLTSGLTASSPRSAVRGQAWDEVIDLPMEFAPGEKFDYGANQLNAFACALERKLTDESFEDYLKRRVFDVLGVTVEWRFRCADGHPQVGGGAFMTARDWGTFGEFIRLGGVWNGEQVIAAEPLAECFQGSEQNPAYGLTWWLNDPVPPRLLLTIPLLRREWSGVLADDRIPDDLVAAAGAGKQRLYIIPSRQLVIVRHGNLRGEGPAFADEEFLRLLFVEQD